jgi:hypothetical protein
MSSAMKYLLALIVLGAAWHFWYAPHAKLQPGIVTPDDPRIEILTEAIPWHTNKDDYTITRLAKFSMRARVLHTKRYWFGRETDLVPVDIAFGWGKMSDQNLLDLMDIDQDDRFYFWHYNQNIPVTPEYIISHSGNMHLIPATDEISSKIKSVRENDIVYLEGYLVKVNATDGWHWLSSTSLSDTGRGACKLIWVQNIKIN